MLRSAGGGGSARAAAAQHRRALARAPHACLCARMVKRAETCMMYGQDVARQMVSGFPSCTAVDQQVTHGASCSPGAPSAGTAGAGHVRTFAHAPCACAMSRGAPLRVAHDRAPDRIYPVLLLLRHAGVRHSPHATQDKARACKQTAQHSRYDTMLRSDGPLARCSAPPDRASGQAPRAAGA